MSACDFEVNRGQTAAEVDCLARCAGYVAFLTRGDAVISTGREAVRLHVVGGRSATPLTLDAQPGRSNYFIGSDERHWVTDVPHVGRVAYSDVRPGVRIDWRIDNRALAFDLVVAPGADLPGLRIALDGVVSVVAEGDGCLSLALPSGGFARLSAPRAWQDVGGTRRSVTVSFADGASCDALGFTVDAYDRTQPLFIDPTLTLSSSTFFGGTYDEYCSGVVTDSTGAICTTGYTYSTDFPVTTGAFRSTKGETSTTLTDAYVTKLNAAGTSLVYSTFLGGNSSDLGLAIAVDASGNAYVGGSTNSNNFPLKNAYQTTSASGFVTKIDPTGSSLVWSTFYGNYPSSIGLDSSGNVHCFSSSAGRAFVFNSAGTGVAYAVSISAPPNGGWYAMAVDPSGTVWLGGYAGNVNGVNYATPGAYQTAFAGGAYDGWIAKLDTNGNEVVRTYVGGDGDDYIRALTVDASGNLLIAGTTTSTNFPLASAAQATYGGSTDAFVTKLNSTASSAAFSTYLGGSAGDYSLGGIVANANGDVYVSGYTVSSDFPLQNAYQSSYAGGATDAFLVKYSGSGTLRSATFLGGSDLDVAAGVAVTPGGRIVVAGYTKSTNFPTQNAWQPTLRGSYDHMVTLLEESTNPFADMAPAVLPAATDGQGYTQTLPVTGGTTPLTCTLLSGTLPPGTSLSSAGVLSGTTTGTATASFTAMMVDADGACALRAYSVTVNAKPAITTASLPSWTVSRPFSQQFAIAAGTPPMTWSTGPGTTLPNGVALASGGLLSGTPLTDGTYQVVAQVVDVNGAAVAKTLAFTVNPVPAITTSSLREWTQNRPYTQVPATTGGTRPFAWTLAAGALPIDKSIDPATGKLDGTSLVSGDYAFTEKLTDAAGATAQQTFAVHLNSWPSFVSGRVPLAAQNRPYTATPGVKGGTSPFGWSITSGTLQEGFSAFDITTGAFSGTPTAASRSVIVFDATDAAGADVSRSFAVVVAPMVDLTKGMKSEKLTIAQADSSVDVVRYAELLEGTLLNLTMKVSMNGANPAQLLLLDSAESPIDLAAWTKVKGRTTTVKGFPVPKTGRYFVIVRPTPGFDGHMTLTVAASAPRVATGRTTVDPVGTPPVFTFSALPNSKLVVTVTAAKGSAAVPTIASVRDANGTDILVAADLKGSKKGAALKVKTPLAGGDYVVTFAPGTGPAGDIKWAIVPKPPRGYRFELPNLGIAGK